MKQYLIYYTIYSLDKLNRMQGNFIFYFLCPCQLMLRIQSFLQFRLFYVQPKQANNFIFYLQFLTLFIVNCCTEKRIKSYEMGTQPGLTSLDKAAISILLQKGAQQLAIVQTGVASSKLCFRPIMQRLATVAIYYYGQ